MRSTMQDAQLTIGSLMRHGIASLSIDLPLHGLNPGSNPFYVENTPFAPIAQERTFDVDFVDNATGAPGPDGVAESAQLALQLLNANRMFATDYPAAMSNSMSNTDSGPFMNLVAAVAFAVSLGLVVYDSWFLRTTRTLR